MDSGKCFWIPRSVLLDFGKCFWIPRSVLIDSEKCFGIPRSVLMDSGKCFWILGCAFGFGTCFGFWEVLWILGRVLDSGK